MKNYLYVVWTILILAAASIQVQAAGQWKDTLVVARDGTGDYRTLTEAMEGIRAFMDYKVTVLIKNGVYKEKVIVPSWLQNVDFVGESAEGTVITYDDHANIYKMGTFRTYTLKVEGNDITFRNLTIENNAAQLGQAVALHTEGDRLHPGLKDIGPLANLQSLQELTINSRSITDLSPLRELTNLQTADIRAYGSVEITDWSPVEHVPNLIKS